MNGSVSIHRSFRISPLATMQCSPVSYQGLQDRWAWVLRWARNRQLFQTDQRLSVLQLLDLFIKGSLPRNEKRETRKEENMRKK